MAKYQVFYEKESPDFTSGSNWYPTVYTRMLNYFHIHLLAKFGYVVYVDDDNSDYITN
jgi:hypothetical protein